MALGNGRYAFRKAFDGLDEFDALRTATTTVETVKTVIGISEYILRRNVPLSL